MNSKTRSPAPEQTHSPRVARLLAAAAGFLRAGRPGDAIPVLREATRWLPANAALLHDLGLACLECGELSEAVAALQGAVAANPRFADSHLRLGIALEAIGMVDAALAAYRTASAVLPSLADARFRAGNLLDSLGQAGPAIDAFRRAAAAAPKTTLGRIATARALLTEDRDTEAEKVLRQALALDKNNAVALDLLGNTLANAGRFAEAREILLRAIEYAPLGAGSYYEIVRCGRIGPEDAGLIASMRTAVALPGLEPAQRSRVHLALGKAADDLGKFQEAMQHFDAAEALRSTIVRFDLASFEARVERLIARFTPAFIARTISTRTLSRTCTVPKPILIVGLPRSGTTLVEQILSAHPAVQAGGELAFWTERAVTREAAWDAMASLPQAAALEAAFLDDAEADYLHLLRQLAGPATHVTDKMPLNIQWAGLVHLALPSAIVVHCRRSPIDTALSIHQTHFNPRMAFPTGGAALVGIVRATDRLAAHWRTVLPADLFVEVDYETLTSDPEHAIRTLVAACGVEWDAACLRPDQNTRVVKTPSKFQARQPIYRTANGRWRSYEPWLGPLRALLQDTVIAS